MKRWQFSYRSAFTLIELLVVVAVIAILAAILFPVFSQAREKARQTQCINNMKNLGMATAIYTSDYDERFGFWRTPCWDGWGLARNALGWFEQYDPYHRNLEIFRCPSARWEWQWNASCYPNHANHDLFRRPNRRVNYGFNETIFNNVDGKISLASMMEPALIVILADNWNTFFTPWARDRDGINVRSAYANGNPWDFGMCGCPSDVTGRATEAQKHAWPRHLGGAVLTFADGHAKWYKAELIRSRHRGGDMVLNWWRPRGECIMGGGSDDGMPKHFDTVL